MSVEHGPSINKSGIIGIELPSNWRPSIEAHIEKGLGVEGVNIDPNAWAIDPTLEADKAFRAALALGAIQEIANQVIVKRRMENILTFLTFSNFGGDSERPNGAALVSTELTKHDFSVVHAVFADEVNETLSRLESPYRL